MEVLFEKYGAYHSTVIVNHTSKEYGLMKFKFTMDIGNCYCDARVQNFTKNGEFVDILNERDILGFKHISYLTEEDESIKDSMYNINLMMTIVAQIFI